MDFPGSITIGWKTFVDHLLDIGRSLIHHGFRRILFVNGHGSNVPLVDMAARLLMLERRDVLAAAFWYLGTPASAELLARTRDSDSPAAWPTPASWRRRSTWRSGPSWCRWTRPCARSRSGSRTTSGWTGTTGRSRSRAQWSGWTESGVIGDATVATAEKGRLWLERAVEEICEYIDEVARPQPRPGRDHHDPALGGALETREGDRMRARRLIGSRRRAGAVLAVAAAAAAVAAAAVAVEAAAASQKGGIFTLGTTNYIDTLNPSTTSRRSRRTRSSRSTRSWCSTARPTSRSCRATPSRGTLAGRQDLDVHAAARRQVVGRPAADGGGRGLDGEHDRQVPGRRRPRCWQRRRARDQGRCARPDHARLPLRRAGRQRARRSSPASTSCPSTCGSSTTGNDGKDLKTFLPEQHLPWCRAARSRSPQYEKKGTTVFKPEPGLLGTEAARRRGRAASTTRTPTR